MTMIMCLNEDAKSALTGTLTDLGFFGECDFLAGEDCHDLLLGLLGLMITRLVLERVQ